MRKFMLVDNKRCFYNRSRDATGCDDGTPFYSKSRGMQFDNAGDALAERDNHCHANHRQNFQPIEVVMGEGNRFSVPQWDEAND